MQQVDGLSRSLTVGRAETPVNMLSVFFGLEELGLASAIALATSFAPPTMEQGPCQPRPRTISQMSKAELLSQATRLGLVVHRTWAVEEIKAVIMEHRESLKEKDPVEQMRRVTHMTLSQLEAKATDLGIDFPTGTTKGNLMRLIRDSINTPDQELMKIGKISRISVCGNPRELLRVGGARADCLEEPGPRVGPPAQLVPASQAEAFGRVRHHPDNTSVPERVDLSGERRAGIHDTIFEEHEPGFERYGKIVGLGSGERQELKDEAPGTSGHDRGKGDGGGCRPEDRSGDRGAGDAPGSPERQGHWEGQVSEQSESEVDGLGGDTSEGDSYDASRFCDPNLGDTSSRGGSHDRKCCGTAEAVLTISEREFVQSFSCKHEVFAVEQGFDSASDGVHFYDIEDETSEHHDEPDHLDGHLLYECRDLTLDDEVTFFYDSGDFSFATLLDLLEKHQAKLQKHGTKRTNVIDPGTEVYCPFGAFVLGGVKGVTKATTENTALVRYLNAFAKAHVGPEATWSSIIIMKGVHSKVHHDFHNLTGSWNYCAGQRRRPVGGYPRHHRPGRAGPMDGYPGEPHPAKRPLSSSTLPGSMPYYLDMRLGGTWCVTLRGVPPSWTTTALSS